MSAVLMDTSFVIAIENLDDPFHARAKDRDKSLSARRVEYILHWGILLQIGDGYARLSRRSRGMRILDKLQEQHRFRIVAIDDDLIAKAYAFYRTRPDKEWGLTDCVSFALMEREGIKEALTADPHFRQAGFVPLLLEPA